MKPRALYSPNQIFVGAILGSPVAGALLMAQNDRAIGRRRAAWITIAVASIGSAAVAAIGAVTNIPGESAIPVVLAIATRQVAEMRFGAIYKQHVEGGGAKRSSWSAVGISVATLVVILGIVIGLAMALPDGRPHVQFGNGSALYYDAASDRPAAEAVTRVLNGDPSMKKIGSMSLRIEKNGDGYAIDWVIKPEFWNSEGLADSLAELGATLSATALDGKPVTMRLCDDEFHAKRELPMRAVEK